MGPALFEARYDEVGCQCSSVLADVEVTLEEMAADKIRMAVCTNKPTAFWRKILEHLAMARHFDAIVGPDVAGIDVAVIASGSSSAQELRDAHPDYFLERFPELLEVVRHGALAAR